MEIISLHVGEFTLALDHYEKALSFYDPDHHLDDAFLYVQNPGIAMRCFAAWSLWFLGQPDQALERIHEAVNLARELSEPHGLAQALFFAAVLHQLRREVRKAQEDAEAAIAISREHGLALYQAMSTATRGWALIFRDQQEQGMAQMGEGLAAHRLTGAEVILPHFLALLVEAFAKAGQVEEGLRVLDEALAVVQRNGERYYLAELYRIKGELLLLQAKDRRLAREAAGGQAVSDPQAAQADDCFHQSIKIAREQKAKSWELRAVMSLARRYQDQNKRAEAHALLKRIYSNFTEGFDTADLREAKALLDELSRASVDVGTT
jgi:predicted ATPase